MEEMFENYFLIGLFSISKIFLSHCAGCMEGVLPFSSMCKSIIICLFHVSPDNGHGENY